MKKNSFMNGAFIATIAIIISKVIGVLYVIPFYPLLGEKGGALYGYAYTIYGLFLNLSTAGIPFAISKITSEYNALNLHYTKERAYKVGKYLICGLGLISFIILFIFSKDLAYIFIGDIEGGNTIKDVSFVIKVVSTALLIVPILSVVRGYLQGQKYITPSSISQVLEQLVRVSFLLMGSFLSLKVFNLSLTTTVGVAVFAATFGALIAYFYMFDKMHKNRDKLNRDVVETREEKDIKIKDIIKKILSYSIPFIMIDLVRSGYSFVDISTINRTMVNLGYKMSEAEAVISVFTTWGMKLNSIIFAVSTGVVVSLIPHITSSYVVKDTDDVKRKINGALQSLIFIILPLSVGLSMLSTPVWTMFFGPNNSIGPMVFGFSIYSAFVVAVFNTSISMLHSLNASKMVLLTLAIGLIIKIIFNIPLMYAVNNLGIHPSYGVTISTIFAFSTALLFNLYIIKRMIKVSYKDTFEKLSKILLSIFLMVIVILLLQLIIPIDTNNRLLALLICLIYGLIGGSVYLFISTKTNLIYEIFGRNIYIKILNKLKLKKN